MAHPTQGGGWVVKKGQNSIYVFIESPLKGIHTLRQGTAVTQISFGIFWFSEKSFAYSDHLLNSKYNLETNDTSFESYYIDL